MFGQITVIEVASVLGTTTPTPEQALTLAYEATRLQDSPVVFDCTGMNADQNFWNAFVGTMPHLLNPYNTLIHMNVYVRFRNMSPSQRQYLGSAFSTNKYLVRQD